MASTPENQRAIICWRPPGQTYADRFDGSVTAITDYLCAWR
jgi:hypothetical protein